jgi:hypothetical protein
VSSWAPVDRFPLMTLMFGALCAADPNRAAPQPNWLSLENSSAPLVLLKNRLGVSEWERQNELELAFLRERLTEPVSLGTTAWLGFGRR